ncbi:hypothetical protein TYRP_016644 [Tyrophagus putrescentiae]|nr:hypothetical protein TYRP_016644 [Tyrophagus putrescentiae]
MLYVLKAVFYGFVRTTSPTVHPTRLDRPPAPEYSGPHARPSSSAVGDRSSRGRPRCLVPCTAPPQP